MTFLSEATLAHDLHNKKKNYILKVEWQIFIHISVNSLKKKNRHGDFSLLLAYLQTQVTVTIELRIKSTA